MDEASNYSSSSASSNDNGDTLSGRSTPSQSENSTPTLEIENVKENTYPLADTWTLKYRNIINYKKGQTTVSWIDSFKLIYKISDVVTFWQIYSNMPWEPTIYSLFKENIDPLWEDPANKNGFSIHYYGEDDEFMTNVILAILGGSIPQYNSVNGFTFDTKRKKYSIWLGCPRSDELVKSIHDFLGSDETPRIEDHQTVDVKNEIKTS